MADEEIKMEDKPSEDNFAKASIIASEAIKEWSKLGLEEKTEVTTEERLVLPLVSMLANSPFPEFTKRSKIKIQSPVLSNFLEYFLKYGISKNRKSRIEMMKIFSNLASGLNDKLRVSLDEKGRL